MADKIEVTYDKVEGHLRQIVEERPDFVYQQRPSEDGEGSRCVYVYEGQPDCLVGHLLFRLGLPIEEISTIEGSTASSACESLFEEGRLVNGNEQEQYKIGNLLSDVQRRQDEGDPWARALDVTLNGEAMV